MDSRLQEKIALLEERSEELRRHEEVYFDLAGSEKSFEESLFLKARAPTVAERKAIGKTTGEYKVFMTGLAKAKSAYNHAKRRYEIGIKMYDGEHITFKVQENIIRRQG